jgi:hypothetical protein
MREISSRRLERRAGPRIRSHRRGDVELAVGVALSTHSERKKTMVFF